MLGIREIAVFFYVSGGSHLSSSAACELCHFGFSFKTVVKNKEECVGKCFSNKEKNVF